MLKRDLAYELFSRDLQALDGLFSREPNRVQWSQSAPPQYPDSRPPTPPPRATSVPPQEKPTIAQPKPQVGRTATFLRQ